MLSRKPAKSTYTNLIPHRKDNGEKSVFSLPLTFYQRCNYMQANAWES